MTHGWGKRSFLKHRIEFTMFSSGITLGFKIKMSDKLSREGRILKHAFQKLFFFQISQLVVVFPSFDDKQDSDI